MWRPIAPDGAADRANSRSGRTGPKARPTMMARVCVCTSQAEAKRDDCGGGDFTSSDAPSCRMAVVHPFSSSNVGPDASRGCSHIGCALSRAILPAAPAPAHRLPRA